MNSTNIVPLIIGTGVGLLIGWKYFTPQTPPLPPTKNESPGTMQKEISIQDYLDVLHKKKESLMASYVEATHGKLDSRTLVREDDERSSLAERIDSRTLVREDDERSSLEERIDYNEYNLKTWIGLINLEIEIYKNVDYKTWKKEVNDYLMKLIFQKMDALTSSIDTDVSKIKKIVDSVNDEIRFRQKTNSVSN